ncbi:LysE family translocator [Mameliella alba]|nr:LysE family translocator [Antarctobacter heliothermus]MBY6143620.1 LysE family translocator [Mameliella alba]MCA0952656.1 LysE family translocator [Mameliella alba]
MTPDLLLALALFAAATVFSPGPNNLMLMTSGANFGLRRSLPHLAGVAYGFPLMILPVGLGVMQLFEAWPSAFTVLKAVSVLYLLWLAWKIANQSAPGEARADARPLSFVQAAAFQWVNPKAWSMALGAITLYAASRDLVAVAWVSGTYAVIGTGSALTWTVLGTGLRRWLTVPGRLRLFNWTMAALLLVAMAPVLLG